LAAGIGATSAEATAVQTDNPSVAQDDVSITASDQGVLSRLVGSRGAVSIVLSAVETSEPELVGLCPPASGRDQEGDGQESKGALRTDGTHACPVYSGISALGSAKCPRSFPIAMWDAAR
jgi:hypothetical protein